MKKKIIILVIISLLIIGGVFWWWERGGGKILWIEGVEMKGSIRDFSVKKASGEIEEEIIIENKKEGLRIKVPDGWRAEKAENSSFSIWGIHIFSPDSEIKNYSPPDLYLLEKGCVIDVYIERSDLQYEVVKSYIESTKNLSPEELPTIEKDGFEMIEINSHQAWKELLYDDVIRTEERQIEKVGKRIEVRIPLKDEKNIYFVFCSSSENKEKCTREFDKFLETVSIE